jgi:signal transduction histidine kinase/DNA-binding response OmpR family regulator/ligand-binding sensor domain-containing protein
MRSIRLKALVWLLTLFFPALVYSQAAYRFKHFDTKDGLAWKGYRSIIQDDDGFIWAQSGKGVSRFDGYHWKNYVLDTVNQTNLPSDFNIYGLFKDRIGNLWTVSFAPSGDLLLMYDRYRDKFIPIQPDSQLKIHRVFHRPGSPEILLGTPEGIFSFHLESHQTQPLLVFADNQENDHVYRTIADFRDTGDDILLATQRGLWLYNKTEKKLSRPPCPPGDTTLLYQADVRKILSYEQKDQLWLSLGRDGVALLDPSTYAIRLQRGGRMMLWTYSYTNDTEGNHYFGSPYLGLKRFDSHTNEWEWLQFDEDKPQSPRSNQINSVLIDREQNLWIATADKGISVRTRPLGQFKNFSFTEFYNTKLDPQALSAVALTTFRHNSKEYLLHALRSPSDNTVLEINLAPLFPEPLEQLVFEKSLLKMPYASNVIMVHPGKRTLWVSFFSDGILGIPFNYQTLKPEQQPLIEIELDRANPESMDYDGMWVWEDDKENLWVGSGDAGLYKIKPDRKGRNHRFEVFLHNPDDSLSVASNQHSRMFVHDKTLWLATTNRGLCKMELPEVNAPPVFHHVFKHVSANMAFVSSKNMVYLATDAGLYQSPLSETVSFTKVPLLGETKISEIHEDNLGRIWLTNAYEALCYDPDKGNLITLNHEHGLLHTSWRILKRTDGSFITIGEQGISFLNPEELKISSEIITPLLTYFEINNRPPPIGKAGNGLAVKRNITHLEELVLDHQHNNFLLEFAALQLIDPSKNRYRYKLDGYDDDWIETDWQNRRARYTNLNPGTYTFRVMASNHHGIWSDRETTLLVKILPPPWQTWWAYMSYGLIFMGVVYGAYRNIVSRERLNTSLQIREMELEKAHEIDRVKTAFFTNISHEFRTPLTLIKGPAQALFEQATSKLDKDQLKTIQRNADLLLKLINQLLELARLESGTISVKKSEENLTAFINAISSSFISLAEQKQIHFNILLPEIHYKASFDFDKLETILINLISNALKFTPANGIINIKSEYISSATDTSSLVLTVSDTGMGIPEELQPKIFERFYQVSDAHQLTGTGIGLALVKEFTELLGGTIVLKSTPGIGSEFILTLPITLLDELSEEQTEEAMIQQAVQSPGIEAEIQQALNDSNPKVLVVEDHADLRKFIIASMGDAYTFSEASDGKEGLARTQAEMPDLIISDVMMPGMDGIEMTSAIRKDIRISHTPVILLTAKASEEAKLTGLGMGADDYLTKPFDKSELNLKVRNSIARQATYREQARISMLKEIPRTEVLSADEQFLQKVKAIILAHLDDEKLSVEAVAGEVGMSRSQLFRKVTALTGSSVNELIRSFRLQKAAQLLDKKWGPVSQVAYEVGFSNLSYFSKCFKEQYGVLPSEYPK